MPALALITADAALARDDDMAPLLAACATVGLDAEVVSWNRAGVDLARFDAALLRSPWDYAERLDEFLAWCAACAAQTTLLNPLEVVRWNTDKHYLADLAQIDIRCVASEFIEPGNDARAGLKEFLAVHGEPEQFVVKPAVGAGSRDARRFARGETEAAARHAEGLLQARRSVLLQPYLGRVDVDGETSLLYFDGAFSHAIRKGPLLRLGSAATGELFAPEAIRPRSPRDDERALGDAIVTGIGERFPGHPPLAYARVDLLTDERGDACLLELELVEPSLFFAHGAGSAERFAAVLAARVSRPL